MKAVLIIALLAFAVSKEINGTPGVDVSAWDGSINWSGVAGDGYKFAILRTTTKGGPMDEYFEENYVGAQNAGLSISGYHYSYSLSTSEAVSDAQNLIDKLGGRKMTIYIDLEWETQGELGMQAVTDIAKAFIQHLQGAGYTVGVYSNTNWYRNYYYPDQLAALGCRFWIAQYGYNTGEYDESWKPNVGEYIWQWTSVGRVSGISGDCDLNMMF